MPAVTPVPRVADLPAAKRRLRPALRALRLAGHRPWHGPAAAAILRDCVLPDYDAGQARWVAGYWAMPGEADPLPALRMLAERGWRTAFPDVAGADGPAGPRGGDLVFRDWPLRRGLPPPGGFGIPAPPPVERAVEPALLLVPLLGVDPAGRRLGQGAGFYDRALARLRRAGRVLAVGWAQECQVLRTVPAGDSDAPLDWIVTERRAIRCDPAADRTAAAQRG